MPNWRASFPTDLKKKAALDNKSLVIYSWIGEGLRSETYMIVTHDQRQRISQAVTKIIKEDN